MVFVSVRRRGARDYHRGPQNPGNSDARGAKFNLTPMVPSVRASSPGCVGLVRSRNLYRLCNSWGGLFLVFMRLLTHPRPWRVAISSDSTTPHDVSLEPFQLSFSSGVNGKVSLDAKAIGDP